MAACGSVSRTEVQEAAGALTAQHCRDPALMRDDDLIAGADPVGEAVRALRPWAWPSAILGQPTTTTVPSGGSPGERPTSVIPSMAA